MARAVALVVVSLSLVLWIQQQACVDGFVVQQGAPRRPLRRNGLCLAARSAAYESYLEAACAAARAAGGLIRDAKAADKDVQKSKSNEKDLLTATDVACQETIAAILAERVPESSLLGEEDVAPGAEASAEAARSAFGAPAECVWAVDPIDGTANFVDSIPLSSVSVAAVEVAPAGPRVVAGVVYDPHRDELFGASRGGGAWVESGGTRTPLRANSASLEEGIIYAGAPPTPRALNPSMRGIAAVAPKCRTMRLLGSAAIMLAYVAAGRGAAYFECDLSAWDTAAGTLLITEAGGRVSDADGADYIPTTRQIVATNGVCHDELLAVLDDVDGARLDP